MNYRCCRTLFFAFTFGWLLIPSVAQPAAYTYNLSNKIADQNGWTITGSITVDLATFGPVVYDNITSWTFSGTKGIGSIGNSSSNLMASQSGAIGLYATPTGLYLSNPGTDVAGDHRTVLSLGSSNTHYPYPYDWIEWDAGSNSGAPHIAYVAGSQAAQYWTNPFYWQTSDPIGFPGAGAGDWLIATRPVPEPSSLVLICSSGAIGLIIAWRRRRRVA